MPAAARVHYGNSSGRSPGPKRTSIHVPPLSTQKLIVDGLQSEQALGDTNIELIERFEKKIQKTI